MLASSRAKYPHLAALSIVFAVVGLLVAVRWMQALYLEKHYFEALISQSSELKNQGLVLQQKGFARPDVLTIYGSSELLRNVPDRANLFFEHFPTQFAVSPVGKPGTTSIVIAEKVAAVGQAMRGRKVAVSLSPSFFLMHSASVHWYAGNFSPLLAAEALFNTDLSWGLRQDLARRMTDFPGTLEGRSVLQGATRCLTAENRSGKWLYGAMLPVARLSNALGSLQDHLAVGSYILEHERKLTFPTRQPNPLAWPELLRYFDQVSEAFRPREQDRAYQRKQNPVRVDRAFASAVNSSEEFEDFELLLRIFDEMGADPLILSIPLNGQFLDGMSLTPQGRVAYYQRLSQLCEKWHATFADFRDHEEDAKFFADTHDHLSAKGWAYYNQALDEFYHDRPGLLRIPATARLKERASPRRHGARQHRV